MILINKFNTLICFYVFIIYLMHFTLQYCAQKIHIYLLYFSPVWLPSTNCSEFE